MIEEHKGTRLREAASERRRLRYEHIRQLYDAAVAGSSYPAHFTPPINDLLLRPPFKALIEDNEREIAVNIEDWKRASLSLPGIYQNFVRSISEAAKSAVSKTIDEMAVELQADNTKYSFDISLASSDIASGLHFSAMAFSLFSASQVYTSDPSPLSFLFERYSKDNRNFWGYERPMYGLRNEKPWNGEDLRCPKSYVQMSIELLQSLGTDWNKVLMKTMTGYGKSFACARCPEVSKLFSWPELVSNAHTVKTFGNKL